MRSTIARAASILAALVLAAGCSPTRPTAPNNTPPPSSADAVSAPAGEDNKPQPSAPAVNAALYAAQTYVRLWARPRMNQPAWYAAIRSWVTPAYANLLADTDPINVPAHAVTGPPRSISATTTVVVADVPTDTGPIRVTVLHTGGRWLIGSADPAPTP